MTLLDAQAVVSAASESGLLLLSDPKRKNAIQILTGEFPRGSWWSHKEANQIYDILQEVDDHPDILLAKLIGGKVTLVHRTLWPALLAVATAREDWQVSGLSPGAARWLASMDEADATGGAPEEISRTVTKEIEARLLARSENVHGKAGSHETKLESWRSWGTREGCQPMPDVARAKALLTEAAGKLGPPAPAFPWSGA